MDADAITQALGRQRIDVLRNRSIREVHREYLVARSGIRRKDQERSIKAAWPFESRINVPGSVGRAKVGNLRRDNVVEDAATTLSVVRKVLSASRFTLDIHDASEAAAARIVDWFLARQGR